MSATERLETLRARRAEVAKQRTEREADLDAAREDLARAVAEGKAPDEALARVRNLAEEVNALTSAAPFLDREIEEAAEVERRAQIAEADADRIAAEAEEAEEAVEALAGAITVATGDVLKLAGVAEDLTERSRRADVRAAHLAGRRSPIAGRAAKAWQEHPPLREVIRLLRAFEAGGFENLQKQKRVEGAA